MKILAFNGSPRKSWNTATLLNKALEGAASKGAKTELIHLYDLNYKGCISCFSCKTKEGKSYGRCPIPDDLKSVFKKVEEADAIILGSPIYFGRITGEMGSFMERLVFQYSTYPSPVPVLFPKKIPTGFIYTMEVTEEQLQKSGFAQHLVLNEEMLRNAFGSSETLYSVDTYPFQFEDYTKMAAPLFDQAKKAQRRKIFFPEDCRKAFAMGARFVTEAYAMKSEQLS